MTRELTEGCQVGYCIRVFDPQEPDQKPFSCGGTVIFQGGIRKCQSCGKEFGENENVSVDGLG